jgi:hypothetical protein
MPRSLTVLDAMRHLVLIGWPVQAGRLSSAMVTSRTSTSRMTSTIGIPQVHKRRRREKQDSVFPSQASKEQASKARVCKQEARQDIGASTIGMERFVRDGKIVQDSCPRQVKMVK